MRKIIFIGCGGSGGQTLRYAMDQICADLKTREAPDRVPLCWQFIHIDAPVQEEEAGKGGFRTVTEYNEGTRVVGSYCSIGADEHFETMAAKLMSTLHNASKDKHTSYNTALEYSSWLPKSPDKMQSLRGVSLTDGAGEYRMIGRTLFLSQLDKVVKSIAAAKGRCSNQAALEDAAEIERIVPELGDAGNDEEQQKVMVFIVGSMAGGSGASMLIDVARAVLEVIPDSHRILYGYTPEIFKNLSIGITPGHSGNALAMASEIIALQSTPEADANQIDSKLYDALGHSTNPGIPTFVRFVPVGLSQGTKGTVMYDGEETYHVYRRLGRGLARLILSQKAFHDFSQYTLGNSAGGAVMNTNQQLTSWGAQPTATGWSAFGYASLSMGRDRFREYAAQRIARKAVDVMTRGHIDPNNPETGETQLKTLIDKKAPDFLASVNLPMITDATQGPLLKSWYDESFSELVNSIFGEVYQSYVQCYPAHPEMDDSVQNVRDWWEQVKIANPNTAIIEAGIMNLIRLQLRQFMLAPELGQSAKLIQATKQAVAEYGLEYAQRMLQVITERQINIICGLLDEWGKNPVNLNGGFTSVENLLAGHKTKRFFGSSSVTNLGQQVNQAFRQELNNRLLLYININFTRLLSQVYRELKTGFIEQLLKGLNEQLKVLNDAKNRTGASSGVELYYTDIYAEWPVEDRIPSRFSTAHNEVVVTETEEFNRTYWDLLNLENPNELSTQNSEIKVIRSVILGQWPTVGGVEQPDNLIRFGQFWLPEVLRDTRNMEEAGMARFVFAANTREVLERALGFIDRKDQAFNRYIAMDLRSYLSEGDIGEVDRRVRQEEMARKFREAMNMAQPMVSVNEKIVKAVHPGVQKVERSLTFSPIPFADQEAGEIIVRGMESATDISEATREAFKAQAKNPPRSGGVTRVDVFGTYQNYSPIAYSSLFKPLYEYWSSNDANREQFTTGRRTRPTTGYVPTSNNERRMMVAGWLLGYPMGLIQVPNERKPEAASIYDITEKQWRFFPWPMYVMPNSFLPSYYKEEWLPAILQSYPLAMLGWYRSGIEQMVQFDRENNPMAAYATLRKLADDSEKEPSQHGLVAAKEILQNYLSTGAPTEGITALIPTESDTPEARLKALEDYWSDLAKNYRELFRTTDQQAQRISSIRQIYQVPMVADLATDIIEMAETLIETLKQAHEAPSSTLGSFGDNTQGRGFAF